MKENKLSKKIDELVEKYSPKKDKSGVCVPEEKPIDELSDWDKYKRLKDWDMYGEPRIKDYIVS